METAFSLARRHGAGSILTNGLRLFKISDYCESDGTAYGWPANERGETIGDYQKLPDGLRTRNGRDLSPDVFTAVAAAGFDVYVPARGALSFLFFTDGTRIGYLQHDDGGSYSLSTVHIPNHTSGTGFRVTDDRDPPLSFTRESLERAFIHAPNWAFARDCESVRKWPDMAAFVKGHGLGLVKVAEGIGK